MSSLQTLKKKAKNDFYNNLTCYHANYNVLFINRTEVDFIRHFKTMLKVGQQITIETQNKLKKLGIRVIYCIISQFSELQTTKIKLGLLVQTF